MIRPFLFSLATLVACSLTPIASSMTIVAGDIPGGASSYTTTDGLVTLTPTIGGSPSTIGGAGSGCCFGVGNDQVNDADGDPTTTGDQDAMAISLDSTGMLNSISFIFTRATTADPGGPLDDGIRISGFASDPGVFYFSEDDPVGSLNNVAEVEGVSFSGDTLNIDHAWRGGAITVFEFANPFATLGQNLTLTVADRDEANPQANLRTLAYSAVPEPSAGFLLGAVSSLIAMRHRRRCSG